MEGRMTSRMEASILASLQDQLLDVKLDIMTLDEWRQRAQGAVDRGVVLPPTMQRLMSPDVFWSATLERFVVIPDVGGIR